MVDLYSTIINIKLNDGGLLLSCILTIQYSMMYILSKRDLLNRIICSIIYNNILIMLMTIYINDNNLITLYNHCIHIKM